MTKQLIPKSAFRIPHSAFLSIAMLLLVGLSACASVIRPEEDPQIVVLQQELNRIEKLDSATRKKVEDIHDLVLAIQAKVDTLQENLDELIGRPLPQSPVTVLPPKTPEAPIPKGDVEIPETKVEVGPVPEKGIPGAKLKKASVSPKLSPERQYEKAYEAYAKHHFDEAMALFKKFLQRYPKHDLADNAQYWIGEAYYDMEDYPNAILAFKEVVTLYAERSKAPDALLKIGYSYVALDDPANARIYFKRVIKNYPFSQAEAKARAKLKELENLPYFPSTENP
ncbi:MAG: tol-pal system protein YbgF [Deltaproteobacteria bacterium]|nr:tol-pal system protein YbgF [Deltaproteobacteria bacterium]